MMDMLGTTRRQQGKFKEAMVQHKVALEGMSCSLGAMNPDTLKAMNNLACVYSKYFEYEKTRELLTESSRGLFQTLGPTHPDTLIAQENLAMVYNDLGGSLRDDGHSIMLDVLAKRKEKLGREHPFTLLAMCHLARTKADRGDFEEAEALLYDGLAVAKQNLGETHLGTLYGRSHLGRVLLMQ